MKAAIFDQPGMPIQIVDIPTPVPAAGEVLVKIDFCGICGTDLHRSEAGPFVYTKGAQFGHEMTGTVCAIGPDVTRFKVGDRVVTLPIKGSCGNCAACHAGRLGLCSKSRPSSQGFAEYCIFGERETLLIPPTVHSADAALAEPLAVARRAVLHAQLTSQSRIVIQGPGPIGLGVLFWAKRAGVSHIVMVAGSSRRVPIAKAAGADVILQEGPALADRVYAALGAAPDVVFECVGQTGILARAVDLVRQGGTIIALGFTTEPDSFTPSTAMFKEVRLQFSMTYTYEDFFQTLQALEEAPLAARVMVTDKVSLQDFPAALERLRQGSADCKILVRGEA